MDKQHAIVIFYTGSNIDTATAEQVLGAIGKHVVDGASQATIRVFNEEDLAKELIRTSMPPVQNTEDGDASVKVVMGLLPIDCRDNKIKCCVTLAKMLSNAEFNNDAKSKAFVHAMSILAQGNAVSKKVALDWGYNKTVKDAIKETYNLFINA